MTFCTLAFVSTVLLVYGTGICTGHENELPSTNPDPASSTEDTRGQLNDVQAKPGCTCDMQNNSAIQYIVDTIKELKEDVTNIKSVTGLLLSQLSVAITPGYKDGYPASSCKEILQLAPQSPSGLYWIRGTDNEPKHMYCDMERSCKGVAGGWMRVASINMTDTSNSCPVGLRTLTSPRRLCAMNTYYPGCSSAMLPVQGIEYSQVCGKIIGYQQRTPDAFRGVNWDSVDSNYVDGISLTHGCNPRKHIWTFAAALHEDYSHLTGICRCINESITPPLPVPYFLGDDYFCDTASKGFHQYIFYEDDPLWDGAGCGKVNTCCSWNSPPWFRKQLPTPTSDDIEMRLCANEFRNNEDITFETLDIYVQ